MDSTDDPGYAPPAPSDDPPGPARGAVDDAVTTSSADAMGTAASPDAQDATDEAVDPATDAAAETGHTPGAEGAEGPGGAGTTPGAESTRGAGDAVDIVTAASPFAPPWELERIAATRSNLHLVLASNPATPPTVLEHLARSTDPRVQEVLKARRRSASHLGSPTRESQVPLTYPPAQHAPAQGQPQAVAPPAADGLLVASLPPASAPGRQGGPGRRGRVTAVVLAVILTLGAAGGTGWYLWIRDQAGTITDTGIVVLSDAWITGAQQLWQQDIDPDAEVAVLGDHVLTFVASRGGSGRRGTTLTGYTVTEKGLTESWSASLPSDTDTETDRGEPDSKPDKVLSWGGSTAVYGSTLIDLETGETKAAPWDSGLTANIAGPLAISCDKDDTCTAWDTSLKRVWSLSIPESGPLPDESYSDTAYTNGFYEPVVHHGDDRFITIRGTVVNLDTGRKIPLKGSSTSRYSYIEPAQDGWAVVDTDSGDRYQVTTYTVEGERLGSFSASSPQKISPILGLGSLRTLEQIRSDTESTTPPSSSVTLTLSDDSICATTVTVDDKAFSLPETSEENIEFCTVWARLSAQGLVAVLYTYRANPMNTVSSVMDLRSGETLELPGTDPEETTYLASGPGLIVAHSYRDGTLTAYTPAM